MVTDAKIDDSGPRGDKVFFGTILRWEESRQNWQVTSTLERGGVSMRASRDRGRTVFLLQGKQLMVSLRALQFHHLDGRQISHDDALELLREPKAVAFLAKGCRIHPDIAKILHPDTIVVTRVSYPVDPLVIDLPEKR